MATVTEALPDQYIEPAVMIERARALVPVIQESREKTELNRRVADDIFDQILDAGLFRMLMPRRFGGFEHGMDVFAEAAYEIARGCGSVGWVHSICSMYQYLLGMYPLEAQEEIWANDPNGCTSASFTPTGTAIKVDGGYKISGNWAFCSGLDNCPWVLVAVNLIENGKDESVQRGYAVSRRSSFGIEDTWEVAGLAGTGSKTVFCEDLFIPEHFYMGLDHTMSGAPPGAEVNPGLLYRIPAFQALSISVAAPILGMAQGAYDEFIETTRGRVTRGAALSSPAPMAQLPTIQVKVGEAAASIDAAKLVVFRDARELMNTMAKKGELSVEQRARNKGNLGFATGLALNAVDILFEASGGKGLQLSNAMQRYWRDAHAAAMHISVNRDAVLGLYGRVHLGLPAGPAQF
ncbi:MAG: Flavin-dependent monooxygenase, oxygenase subunit HsaA [Alphaproteobacteria bacterium MarineAlpha11_Bin1]|nr:MAG: Flavin-dependent monooxygenase, oxygenase subunit HsaA [Alphaproteobacteria bacterium MarineAlpha11_Bin1]|tara:strand:- start:9702 stop:10919 length:1218 start_codon:yes stop_codon:yes gene_type:complete